METDRILIIDDDPDIGDLVGAIFRGSPAEVHAACGGQEGLRQIWQLRPDLIILDVMMPDLSGWDVCRRIREMSNVPVIFLSVLDGDEHIVQGLRLGADDYICKPMKPSILKARVEALLRRTQWERARSDGTYDDGYLHVDLPAQRVEVAGERVKLTRTEFALLALLVRNAGRICTMEHIQKRIWGGEGLVSAETVHVFISQLRKKIEPKPHSPRYIHTEHGVGYRFE